MITVVDGVLDCNLPGLILRILPADALDYAALVDAHVHTTRHMSTSVSASCRKLLSVGICQLLLLLLLLLGFDLSAWLSPSLHLAVVLSRDAINITNQRILRYT